MSILAVFLELHIICVLYLKVHKIENFFDFDFGILVKHFFDGTIMGGAMIFPRSPRTTRNEKKFQDRPKFFFFLNHI